MTNKLAENVRINHHKPTQNRSKVSQYFEIFSEGGGGVTQPP